MNVKRSHLVELIWAAVALAVGLSLAAVWAWRRDLRPLIMLEHQGVELATMWAFLLAVVAGAAAAIRHRGCSRLAIALAALGVLGAGEEASFVLRFGLTPPRLLDVQLDCFHDLMEVAYRFVLLPGHRPYLYAAVALGALAGLTALYLLVKNWRAVLGLLRRPPWRLLVVAAALLAMSVLFDFKLVDGRWRPFFEEVLELEAALALLFAAIACWFEPRAPRQADPRDSAAAAASV